MVATIQPYALVYVDTCIYNHSGRSMYFTNMSVSIASSVNLIDGQRILSQLYVGKHVIV